MQDFVACVLLCAVSIAFLAIPQVAGWGAGRMVVVPVEAFPASVQANGIDGVERNATGFFRWTRPQATLVADLRVVGEYVVTLDVQDTPQNATPRTLTVRLDGETAGAVVLGSQPGTLSFRHTGLRGRWDRALPPVRIELQTTPYRAAGDARELGVIFRGATIRPVAPTPVQWLRSALTTMLILCGLYGLLRAFRMRQVPAALAVVLGSAALLVLLALQEVLLPLRLLDALVARPAALAGVVVGLAALAGLAWLRPTRRVAVAAALAVPALPQIGLLLWMIWVEPVQVPWWDELFDSRYIWHFLDGTLAWSDLWQIYVAHRNVTVRLIHLLVIGITGWDRRVLLTLQLGIMLLAFVFLARLVGRTIPDPRLRPAVLAAIGALLFALSQYALWLLTYGMQFQLVVLGVAAALWLLSVPQIGWGRLGLALAVAWLASWTGLHGIAIWGALLPLLWRTDWAKRVAWLVCAGVMAGTYAIDFPRSTVQGPGLGELLRFTFTTLGAPLGILQQLAQRTQFWQNENGAIDARWSFAIGLASAALLVLNLGVAAARRDREVLERALPWCCLALFAAACAVLTGLGRTAPANAALTSRYQTISMLWWVALVAIGGVTIWRSWPARDRRFGWRHILVAANILALALGGGAFFEVNVTSAVLARDLQGTLREAESCARDFTTAPDSCLIVLHPPAVAARVRLAQLASHRLALYRQGPVPAVPTPAGDPQSAPSLNQLQQLGFQTFGDLDQGGQLRVATGAPVVLSGWAIDVTALPLAPAAGVYLQIDDRAPLWVPVDRERPEIAWRFEAAYLRSGFRAELPAGTLAPGEHTVRVIVVTANRQGRYPPGPPEVFGVE